MTRKLTASAARPIFLLAVLAAFSISVVLTFGTVGAAPAAHTFGSQTISDQSWTQNTEVSTINLPMVTGNVGPVSYSLSPALPAGVIRLSPTIYYPYDNRIGGTPTVAQARTQYTWSSTDSDGHPDAVSLTFYIEVAAQATTPQPTADPEPTFGSTTISDQSWTQNMAITALDLPTATGGNGSLTYSLSPSLPTGVSKNASHQVSGTPTLAQARTQYTWTATDSDGDSVSLTFYVTVATDLKPRFYLSSTIDDQSWTQNSAITAFTLPEGYGGDAPLSYSISPALPAGVSKNSSHQVSGTPTGTMSSTEYTWTVEDSDGDTASLTFDIAIAAAPTSDLQPSFGSSAIDDQSWTQNTAITTFTLPSATGGDGSLTYSLSPSLPTGVSKSDSHEVSGTPMAAQARAKYTWTATDSDGDTVSLTFDIVVTADTAPSFGSDTIADQSWTQNTAITAFTLPSAKDGNGLLTYALSPALPAGVSKSDTDQVSGTPTATKTTTEYTWTVTDSDGDTASLTFDITVTEDTEPSFGSATIADKSWTQNTAITTFTLPSATGGNGSLTYALSPALPAGVSKSDSHQVSGTPTATKATTEYTWTVTDADGDTASLTFDITVAAEDLQPTFGSATISDKSWTQNEAITAFTLPSATGGDGSLTYSLSPSLPAGVSKSDSHSVSGTPTAAQASAEYTWTATDSDGDAVSLTFDITVAAAAAPDLQPSFGSQTIADQSWTQNTAITTFTLPSATGGDGSLTYSLSPTLPAGVSKSASHEVSGTPTAAQASAEYTWTATDADGDAASLTFDITVAAAAAPDLQPSFGSATIADQSWMQNSAITALDLPTATGGDGTLTYSLSPALVAGVSKSATHRVSGTPTAAMASAEYTWTATDADGDTASLTFNIAVAADLVPTFGSQTISDKNWRQNRAITAFTLPSATSGNAPLTYALSPALVAGVSKDANHRVSGTPTVRRSNSYTWTVTDADGDTAFLTFGVEVSVVNIREISNSIPSFGSQTVSDQSWTQGQSINAFTLPEATGGDGTLTYSLSPSLPAGVSKSDSHRVSGAPSVKMANTEYTWTATDEDGDTDSVTFDISVDGVPSFGSQTVADQSWTQYEAVTAFNLPQASGGDGTLTYALSPALTAGVSKNANHRVSGTPGEGQANTEYTWTATDSDGDTATLTFNIAVDGVPSFGAQTGGDQAWTQGQQITAFSLPAATGGDGALTYSLSPALPAGVTKNVSNVVSGTPTVKMAVTEYTWTATDQDGDAASLTFHVSVNGVPSFGDQTISEQAWTQRQPIVPFNLPTATGGDGALTYSLSPDLAAGVTKSDGHGLSGAPGEFHARKKYTWTAADADGSTASLEFYVTVAEDLEPSFGSRIVTNKTWTQREQIASFLLPVATGGDAPVTYALTPALPNGVTRSLTDHRVSGSPTVKMTEGQYTWTATDADGDSASISFTIEVKASLQPDPRVTVVSQPRRTPPPATPIVPTFPDPPNVDSANPNNSATPVANGPDLATPEVAPGVGPRVAVPNIPTITIPVTPMAVVPEEDAPPADVTPRQGPVATPRPVVSTPAYVAIATSVADDAEPVVSQSVDDPATPEPTAAPAPAQPASPESGGLDLSSWWWLLVVLGSGGATAAVIGYLKNRAGVPVP